MDRTPLLRYDNTNAEMRGLIARLDVNRAYLNKEVARRVANSEPALKQIPLNRSKANRYDFSKVDHGEEVRREDL